MLSSMVVSPLLFAGFTLVNAGFWPMFFMLARRNGLGSSMASMGRAAEAFRAPASMLERLVLWGGPVLVLLGSILCFIGVVASDADTRSACRALCSEQGFADGRMRGNPHVERPGETPRQCWCFHGTGAETSWAADGLDLPPRP